MKFLFHPCPRLAVAFSLAAAGPLTAGIVTLDTADAFGVSSFNTGGGWSDGTVPGAGNDYVVSIERLRTPVAANDYTFSGDSLTLSTAAGKLSYKGEGSGTITVPDLILEGGIVDHINAANQIFTLAGGITVHGTGSRIAATQGPIHVTASIGGEGELRILNNLGVTFSADNTFTGELVIDGAFVLAGSGSLLFEIGASGVNNRVSGAGPAAFDGLFDIDLAGAGTTPGDSWVLVTADTLAETYGAGFQVVSGNDPWFKIEVTAVSSVWVSPTGDYRFDGSTGILQRVAADSDQDGLPDAWELAKFGDPVSSSHGSDDPDLDWCSNFLEYLADTDPESAGSFPDTDADTLPDGWEYFWFGNLLESAAGDPDGDWNDNLVEFTADTDPSAANDYPDEDDGGSGDQMNDGWEIHYFGSIAACLPDVDDDGDLSSNLEEFWESTDPTDQVSSPDTDDFFAGDGLPDGWEVKYFRVGSEDLETVIAKWGPNDDPDSDGLGNFQEFLAGTSPTDPLSVEKTLGYWRFEEATAGEVPAGGNGAYAFPTSIQDSSVYGNHMMAWADYSRPNHDPTVRAATVPATGDDNTGSLYFQRNGNGIYYIEAVFSTPTDYLGGGVASLRTFGFDEFTIEASFNTTLANQWQVPLAKFGNPVGGQPPFSLKLDPANFLRAGIVDGSGVAREIIGTTPINTNSWYSAAVTGTATGMKLWLKGPGDSGYKLEGEVAIAGAWYEPAGAPLDTPWNIGQGMWNNVATDAFQGYIDEVRISAVALAPDAFLFHEESGFASWAEANIPDPGQRGEGDDPDGDGTANGIEFLLGLAPMDGTSFFAATFDGGALSWPAVDGLSFTVQRSTSLMAGSWTDEATVIATGGTASWTDPAPLAGKAFYRIVFATD